MGTWAKEKSEEMNDFEEAIMNLPYSTDWFKRRCMHFDVIISYSKKFDYFRVYTETHRDENDKKWKTIFIIIKYKENLYVYTDWTIDGLVEGAQLDKILDNIVSVMYSHLKNVPPIAPIALKLLEAGVLERDYRYEFLIEERYDQLCNERDI